MQFQIKPSSNNSYPLKALLLKGDSPVLWLKEIQRMELSLNEVELYPVPGNEANTVWACLVLTPKIDLALIGMHEQCQQVSGKLYIPEKTTLEPPLMSGEAEKLFSGAVHLFHPEIGLAELPEQLTLRELIELPACQQRLVTRPAPGVYIPRQVRSFQIKPVAAEEVLKNLEEKIFPKREAMPDKPLNISEKGKLALYRSLFKRAKKPGSFTEGSTQKTELMGKLESIFNKLFKGSNKWMEKMQGDYEDLERRNQDQLNKLLELLKNNPREALKYAIPLDEGGGARGGVGGVLGWNMRWLDFSLFSSNAQGGSGTVDLGERYFELQNQYNNTAIDLIKQGEYQQAAFIYMKLLKNSYKAAEIMEAGKYYQEAAIIYLKHAHNKSKAAECYEKGNMLNEAIELYKELNENEKAGDLYLLMHKNKEANFYFGKSIAVLKDNNKYVKASQVYQYKMGDEQSAQALLVEGWRDNKEAVSCLNTYLENIPDLKQLNHELTNIYHHEVNEQNREQFLQVLQHEFKKQHELAPGIREMAYEIIAAQLAANPSIVSELKSFNRNNKELYKDTFRFNLNRKK